MEDTKDVGFRQKVVYEGNLEFFSHCCLQGHITQNCRKVIARQRAAENARETPNTDGARPTQAKGGAIPHAGVTKQTSNITAKPKRVWMSKRQANK